MDMQTASRDFRSGHTAALSRRACLGKLTAMAAGCLFAVALIPISGCATDDILSALPWVQNDADAEELIRSGLNQDLEALKSLTDEQAATMFSSAFTSNLTAAGLSPAKVYQPVFDRLTWTIEAVQVKEDSGAAVAFMTVGNTDAGAALALFAQKLAAYLAQNEPSTSTESAAGADATGTATGSTGSQSSPSQDSSSQLLYATGIAQLLQDSFADGSISLVNTSVAVALSAEGSSWSITNPDELASAVLGGLSLDGLSTALDNALAQVPAAAQTVSPAQEQDQAQTPAQEQVQTQP